ncbi:hypothetical protein E9549_08655 [Blastococcus sp. MG754426]|uniref:hypothetical protein n=1 Tax=unclassified Blastococcus TaxID=2619396 RepID=UPI001EEF7B73|nr:MULTISPECIES: hypothetical protein [unclassified Blastococcus]MCF6507478.1 hypothetical protein [Blastococcus sp. MG754426]MCF6512595.1 hypothetical protein [Blastococcus sp. MG754427]MCF6733622.1 hypothetical protein [Blastococcus sp. KM273129]
MSSVMESRAAVFTSQPQVVEVHQAGNWCAGELLGWRHDDAGACQMWVRVVVDGVECTAWTDLAAVRLPEPPPAEAVPATRVMPAQAPSPSQEAGPVAHDETAGLPLERDAGVRPATARPEGRRRAPEVAESPATPRPATAAGRHRAPATASAPAVGRHRAADTGHLEPVVTGGPVVARGNRSGAWAVPAARAAHPVERRPAGHGWTPPADVEPDLLTRPMRLGNQVPHSRRPRLDGAVHV